MNDPKNKKMLYAVFIRNAAADCGGKWRLLSRNESTGFKIRIIATEIQAKHKQFEVWQLKYGDQQFPDQKETGSWTLIPDTIWQQINGD